MIDKIIKELKNAAKSELNIYGGARANGKSILLGYQKGLEDAVFIVNQIAKEYNDGWILCSERLPQEDKASEYYESVIVTLDDGRVAEGCYTGIEWWVDAPDGEHYSEDMTGHVIAWQPLPEPYKGEENPNAKSNTSI